MQSARIRHRHAIAVLVCLLALGVASLANAAKCSQYGKRAGASAHLSQQIKMSNDGAQTSADFVFVAFPCFVPPLLAVVGYVAPPAPAAPPRPGFLEVFHLRPPPFLA